MKTNSEEMRARPPGQFSVRLDGAVVTPATSWQRELPALLALPARPALAAQPRADRLRARRRRHDPGVRLPSMRQAGRPARAIPRAGGIRPLNGMVISPGGCKLFSPAP